MQPNDAPAPYKSSNHHTFILTIFIVLQLLHILSTESPINVCLNNHENEDTNEEDGKSVHDSEGGDRGELLSKLHQCLYLPCCFVYKKKED